MKHIPEEGADQFARARRAMVKRQIAKRGVEDPRVLEAMRLVPRHLFIPERYRREAYADSPLPIGHDQTISQPYIVARMTELLALTGTEKVLEIGTGCGYQTAVLALLAREVYSIEIVPELYNLAAKTLKAADNVHLFRGDGRKGLKQHAPFDRILVAAAPRSIPPALTEQLAMGGILVIPVGDNVQDLQTITRTPAGLKRRSHLPVRFVPLTGKEIN